MIYTKFFGDGSPHWLFLHGFLESSSMWSYLPLSSLPGTKVLVDLPGHGHSALPQAEDAPSIEAMAREIEFELAHLKDTSLIVVGHSLGGYVGLELLTRKNMLIQRLVMLNSNCWEDSEEKKKDRIRVADIAYKGKGIFINEAIPRLFSQPDMRLQEIEHLKNEALQLSADGIAYASLAMRTRKDFTEIVQENPASFVFIHGKDDTLIQSDELINKVSKSANYLLENAGHMAHIEATEDVIRILNDVYGQCK